jgi:hypothetical protein
MKLENIMTGETSQMKRTWYDSYMRYLEYKLQRQEVKQWSLGLGSQKWGTAV